MKQSQHRHFRSSDCDCRECQGGMRNAGYMVLVAVLLIASFIALFGIAYALFPSTQIVK